MGVVRTEGYCFALAPSLGLEPIRSVARRFADVLSRVGFSTVQPTRSYQELEEGLLSGALHAAWGPPMICARIEDRGGTVALRAVRFGSLSYRSVLLCRSSDDLDIKRLGAPGSRPLRAVWVDRWSMGGYLLPRAHLRAQGLDPTQVFAREEFLGSYADCFEAVLERQADMTAAFAGRRGLGHVELCGERASELRTLAFTQECPNDGIVLSPKLSPEEVAELRDSLRALIADADTMQVLSSTFDVDGFDEPPRGAYRGLWAFLGAR